MLFVVYAIASYIYRWVVTFGIIWFFYQFLKPYKLGAVGGLIAVAALSSMVGMPIYQLIESLRKRGRLPDMKQWRVMVSLSVLGVVLLLFFFLPLPVARVRQTGLVQVQPEYITRVHVPVPAIGDRIPGVLEHVYVEDGQAVEAGHVLAEFRNLELELALGEATAQLDQETVKLRAAQDLLNAVKDESDRGRYRAEVAKSRGEQSRLTERVTELRRMKDLLVLRAPCAGVVLSPPRTDEIGRQWDRDRTTPFCGIGDPTHLRVLVPVSTSEHDMLKEAVRESEKAGKDVAIDLRVQGRGERLWRGKLAYLPQSDAHELPISLTNLAGGPVAARPPQAPTKTTTPPCRRRSSTWWPSISSTPTPPCAPACWRRRKSTAPGGSAAWWSWRTLSSTFDLGLL